MLKVGDRAPEFTALSTSGAQVSLAGLRGRYAVIYFYPKAFTPGCTVETRKFRDNYAELQALGAEVVGISVDVHDTQCKFAKQNELQFPLVADGDKQISRAFGVLRPLLPFDKRVTFVLDEDGVVAAVFHHEFQVSKHLDDVMHFLQRRGAR